MKSILLLILTIAIRSLAGDPARADLQTGEVRVSPPFMTWLEDSDRELAAAKASFRADGIIACYRMSLGSRGPWPSGASAIYIVSSNRLIVRHTAPFIKALEQLAEQWRRQGAKTPPDPKLLQILHEQCPSEKP